MMLAYAIVVLAVKALDWIESALTRRPASPCTAPKLGGAGGREAQVDLLQASLDRRRSAA